MEEHSKTIIHIDIDCFYAQVEMLKNPNLKNKPVGIQQKNIVVTSNYTARSFGIKKCMLVSEAKKLCPNLVLVNGEDLYAYRQMSYKVTSLISDNYSDMVERLGLDENFIDISNLVSKKLQHEHDNKSVGIVYGNTEVLCDCGCTERILQGAQIAKEIRDKIYQELGLTTCAGIAHNKLLSKIVCAKNKPNKQTLVFPNSAVELMLSLNFVVNIPWIGHVTAEQLKKLGITKVEELQNSSFDLLQKNFGTEKAKQMLDLSFGKDNTNVKKSGKPQSIGLEDSCKAITTEKEVKDKLKHLLERINILLQEDGRLPKTVKVTVRKFNINNPQKSERETRQCNIEVTQFHATENKEKIMDIIMSLFKKIVDIKKSFNVTLLGIAFSNFREKPNQKNTLNNFCFSKGNKQEIKSSVSNYFTSCSTWENSDESLEPCLKKARFELNNVKPLESENISWIGAEATKKETCDYTAVVQCPPDVDQEVFNELPENMQKEIWFEYYKHTKTNTHNEKSIVNSNRTVKYKPNNILNYFKKD